MMNKSLTSSNWGYCSYNNMAHAIEKGQYFLFRTKDIHSEGLVGNFDFPDTDSFDIQANVTLVRSHKKKISIKEGFYRRYVDVNASFDYVTYRYKTRKHKNYLNDIGSSVITLRRFWNIAAVRGDRHEVLSLPNNG